MSAQIDGLLAALAEAYKTDNEAVGLQAALALLGEGLKDLKRVADALEILAKKAMQA